MIISGFMIMESFVKLINPNSKWLAQPTELKKKKIMHQTAVT